MKTAYLLLVHDQPELTVQLVNKIGTEDNFVFIHVDEKSDQDAFIKAVKKTAFSEKVLFINNRIHCYWGRYSLVQATINLLKEAFNSQQKFDHYILLSGRDYPIKSAAFINNFLQKNKSVDFFEYYELPDKRLCEREDGIYRVNRFHYHSDGRHKEFPPYSKKPILNPLFNSAAKFYYSTIRKMPLNMKVYAGSQWWILSSRTVKDVLQLLDKNKNIEKFFENVWIPDELFFQTIILHLKKDRTDIINNNFRYISWQIEERSRFIHIPKILTCNDFETLKNSEAFFARKFDVKHSNELIQKIDSELLLEKIH